MAKTQYDNLCKQASISQPIILMMNQSTGYMHLIDPCTRLVDTGHFLMHVPKWLVATGCKPTCDRLMLFLDRLTLPIFFCKTKMGTCYRLMHCLNRLKLPKFYEKKIQQADHIRRHYSRLDQGRRIHTFYEEPILNITFLTHDSSMFLMEIVITFLFPSETRDYRLNI